MRGLNVGTKILGGTFERRIDIDPRQITAIEIVQVV